MSYRAHQAQLSICDLRYVGGSCEPDDLPVAEVEGVLGGESATHPVVH